MHVKVIVRQNVHSVRRFLQQHAIWVVKSQDRKMQNQMHGTKMDCEFHSKPDGACIYVMSIGVFQITGQQVNSKDG